MALIKCKNAAFGYEGKSVVENVNFDICAGDYLFIVGENGSGKSTLIKGLLKLKAPIEGEVLFNDGLKQNEIGYLPQQAEMQRDFPASVFEAVLSGRLNKTGILPFYSKADKKDALEKMQLMGISDIKNKSYQELSGGQQQRVLLARALCATSKVLLLDEPVTGLDPVVTSELYTLIKKINSQMGITVIMVSHDINAALKYAGKILHIGHKELFFGTKDEYLKSEIGKSFSGGAR